MYGVKFLTNSQMYTQFNTVFQDICITMYGIIYQLLKVTFGMKYYGKK